MKIVVIKFLLLAFAISTIQCSGTKKEANKDCMKNHECNHNLCCLYAENFSYVAGKCKPLLQEGETCSNDVTLVNGAYKGPSCMCQSGLVCKSGKCQKDTPKAS